MFEILYIWLYMLKRGKDMISQKVVVLIICVFSLMAFAQNKPKIAIYVIGGELKPNEIEMIETKILTPFVQSEKYTMVERGDSFLGKLAAEMKKQRDGSVDDSQIRSLGKQSGVQFVCIAKIVEAFGIISVSARLIDTESANVPKMGETEVKSLSEIGQAANEIFRQINGEKAVATNQNKQSSPPSNSGTVTDSRKVSGSNQSSPLPKVFIAKGVNFISGKAALTLDAQRILMEIAETMQAHSEISFKVVGHTDNVGSRDAIQELSENRAKSVVDFLVSRGISASRLEYEGRGSDQPIASNNTASGREKNRRIEFQRTDK
jgi:outer membrane protein OmpA-like peptidoglycan-associated protein